MPRTAPTNKAFACGSACFPRAATIPATGYGPDATAGTANDQRRRADNRQRDSRDQHRSPSKRYDPTMRMLIAVAFALMLIACERAPAPVADKPQAPVIDGLGSTSVRISTRSALAQRYFDQGIVLAWGFDFAEAARSFAEAARLDPLCAMCEWGRAHVIGPNINHPQRTHLDSAIAHARRAMALAANATPREQALIRAQALRFGLDTSPLRAPDPKFELPGAMCVTRPPTGDTDPLDLAYAQQMGRVAAQFPDDSDIALLHAEALLLLAPWDWWSKTGGPREGTLAAIAVLNEVLARAPDHPGANHYLIHALERSPTPERALAAAERLGALVPIAGHLVHMPAHIFVRLGRYDDATRANQAAIEADARLAEQLLAQGFAPLSHQSHHQHFLWSSATLQGRGDIASAAARALASEAAREGKPLGADGSNDYFLALPLFVQVRFGQWSDILSAPEPRTATTYSSAVWHWARGMAHARSGDAARAHGELAALERAAADPSLAGLTWKGIDDLTALLAIAQATLTGEIALSRRSYASAVKALQRAVELEDALEAEEPPPWAYSTRHALGGALLLAGRAREAEQVFREDLKRYPANGWALYGLAESLRRQARRTQAERIAAEFARVWQAAGDIRPDSRY